MRKGAIQQEDMTLVNMYAPNIEAPKYVKHILMDIKGEINRSTGLERKYTHSWGSRGKKGYKRSTNPRVGSWKR